MVYRYLEEDPEMLARIRQYITGEELSHIASEEYLGDIMQHLKYMEDLTLPDLDMMDMQREIQWFMRPSLIDFLIETHDAFSLRPETLFLSINLLDRYCSKRAVLKEYYQLVGCASLLIAAKFREKRDRVPQIHELSNMCCGLYDSGRFVQMEMHILNAMDWTIGHPTIDFFSGLIVAHEGDDREVENMAAYICEIGLYHRCFVSTKPSVMARASLTVARDILSRPRVNDGEWDLISFSTLCTMFQHLQQPSEILTKKYSALSMSRVAITLTEFLAQPAAISRHPEPPTPPSEYAMVFERDNIYSTT